MRLTPELWLALIAFAAILAVSQCYGAFEAELLGQ